MAIEVLGGAVGGRKARLADPALDAGRRFAGLLQARGIRVVGPVVRAAAPAGATPLARVDSAPVEELVEEMLTDSDNTVAEALARLVAARAGRPATFADAGAAVLEAVRRLGIPTAGVRLVGGSGLGAANAVPAHTLTSLLVLAASPGHPELRAILPALPVAGASGTLADRFAAPRERAGRGVVRAKTGTLTGVSTLAGTLVDADGRLIAFAVMADRVPPAGTLAARRALDAVAVTLAGCGCR
jgi:D-alanyl-D-alanine carboxypeptidase/D-alanyl-D-alanine-endopeptidase (penicillin-binding protein 4)